MKLRALALGAAVAALASCASPFTDIWQDPDWKGQPLTHVLVVGKTADASSRRIFEDELTARLTAQGIRAEPSYRRVPDDGITADAIAAAVAAEGQDGMLAARLVGVEERARYVPGMRRSTSSRMGLGWRNWGGFQEPGTWRIDRIARIETQAWSFADQGTLIWSGTSESVNPRDVATLSRSLSDAIVGALQKAEILAGH